MGISISKVRIENFRSIENLELSLSMTNVLIGANNCGKSNFLKAINVALGQNKIVSSEDIYVGKDEVLDNTKCATIDIMLRPVDTTNKILSAFSDFWIGVFTEEWITTGDPIGDYVGIRTILQYDALKNDYIVVRKQITDWGDSISSAGVSRRKAFTGDMNTYITAFYMDAQRDVVDDIKDRKSYFGRATSRVDLSQEKISEIERQLNDVNSQIVDSIPALSQTATRIAAIASTVGAANGTIEIEPLARKMTDLHKGMDVIFRDGEAARLSVSQHGMGTRSWISFLTLGAYVDWEKQRLVEDDPESESYIMLTMEEPEAHLHPQAQQKLYSQLCKFSGQKIISTHSPSIVAQAELCDLIHFEKINGKTQAHSFNASNYTEEEKNRIKREVISSHGELLFAKAIVLCEGITEEQALPIYFQEKYGIDPTFCGINIIGIGGQNYKTFLSLIKNFHIHWYIFSDGESSTIRTVKKAVRDVFGTEIDQCDNVIILDNQEDYEKHLLNNGYENEIVEAICLIEGDTDFVSEYVRTRDHTVAGREKTSLPKCTVCQQFIYQDVIRDYSGIDGWRNAIYDCCTAKQAKAKYAIGVAEKIVSVSDESRRIPPKINSLLDAMSPIMSNEGEFHDATITETTTNSQS
ncbi:MAG: AAA family ATPase [Acutalibacteraceae bacterium]|nr:AAA family ATPase [Acutalibacteraceae bacterium]